MRTFPIVSLISSLTLASSAHAQYLVPNPATRVGQTASAKALPEAMRSKRPESLVRTVSLSTLPKTWVKLETRAGFDLKQPALTNPEPALAVTRTGIVQPGSIGCPAFTDRIDLLPLRRNRYRLSDARLTRYGVGTLPAAASDPLVLTGLDAAGNPLPQGAFGSYFTLVVRAQPVNTTGGFSGPQTCTAGYRLSLAATGPRGVHPLTGDTVPF